MKKVLIGLLGLLLLTSCTETIVQECPNWKVVDITAPENSWGWDAAGGYYFATVDVPELTDFVCKDGFVQIYEVDGDYQWPLPYTRYKEDEEGNRWEVTMDYEFAPGVVYFYCSANDFLESHPGEKHFRLVLQW